MNRFFVSFAAVLILPATAQENLRPALEKAYGDWREAIVRRDANQWQRTTAEHRRVEVRNRIVSEQRPFPGAVFQLPAPPPALAGLRFLQAKQNGPTAKASYFGKVDFGAEAAPTENLLVLSFANNGGRWLYDRADFVNLSALPDVRKELAAGNLRYLEETPEAQPSGVLPPTPISANPAKYIAKVYVFCPGREVRLQVNKISRHRFANAKEAEVVIGGAVDGLNEIQYTVNKLEGGTGREAMTIRVYLMSSVAGVQPVKAFEYQVLENQPVQSVSTGTFVVDAETARRLTGR